MPVDEEFGLNDPENDRIEEAEEDALLARWHEEIVSTGGATAPTIWSRGDTCYIVVALVAWGILALSIPSEELPHVWAMPFLGVCSGIVGNAFPVAGGVIFVPVLLVLGEPVHAAVAFSVATQSFGNGVFGVTNWLLKDPEAFIWPVLPPVLLGSWLGVYLAIFAFPAGNGTVIRAMCGGFTLLLAIRSVQP